MGVGLKPHLPDGTYTATYRVISADTHIVYGGLVFNIGHAGAAPDVHRRGADRPQRERRGHEDRLRRRARARLPLDRADDRRARVPAVRLAARPAAVAGAEPRWPAASSAFARRLRGLLAAAIVLGLIVSVLGVLLQGASAAGRVAVVLAERHDHRKHARQPLRQVWGARALDWILLARCCWSRARSDRDVVRVLVPGDEARRGGAEPAPAARDPRAARARRAVPRDHPGAGRPREHREPRRGVLPLRRPARARGQRVGRRDRMPAARAARRRPAGSSAPSAAVCCSRRSSASRRSRSARWS